MHRPRHSGWLLLIPVLVALALTAAGCGGSEHDLMVRKFFTSAATGDVATLGNIATVSFDPNKDGRAQNVKFVSETPEQTRVLKIAELEKVYKEAQAAEADFSKRMKEYQDKNIDAINRIVKIEQSGKGKPGGGDAGDPGGVDEVARRAAPSSRRPSPTPARRCSPSGRWPT